jgi:urease accessory protein
LLKSSQSVLQSVGQLMRLSIAPQDGRACALAHRLSRQDDALGLARLNSYLTASRWAEEPREASLHLGARFLKLCLASAIVSDLNGLNLEEIHHSAAFGWVCARVGISAADAVCAYLYTGCAAMVSACVRLIPLGQTEGQVVLAGLRVQVDALVDDCLSVQRSPLEPSLPVERRLPACSENAGSNLRPVELEDLMSFSPMHEQACVEHQTLYSRLFQS